MDLLIMDEEKSVYLRRFESLEDFIEGFNNFYMFFLNDCPVGEIYRRIHPCFKRFQEQNLEMEAEVTRETVKMYRESGRYGDLPNEKLWKAYKIMSKLVFRRDDSVVKNGEVDDWYLCR